MTKRYPIATDDERASALGAAVVALQEGGTAVIPTDTVYGIAADAFDKGAVAALLKAKGRGRDMPPPVLISNVGTLDALATRVPGWARALIEKCWPGALTMVFHEQPSLRWDLGETRGTVAVRMPDDRFTRDLIDQVGPLAVSSANRTGRPAATDADQAEEMLGDVVQVIVDAGALPQGEASTIIDATADHPRVLRAGALPLAEIDEILAEFDLTVGE